MKNVWKKYTTADHKICPVCRQLIINYPAISRRDNTTYICSDCGQREALAIFTTKNN